MKVVSSSKAHLRISNGKPILRGLGVFHGMRGYGVSVRSKGKVMNDPRLRIGDRVSELRSIAALLDVEMVVI